MGIEPMSEAWEAMNKTLKAIDLAALCFSRDGLIGNQMETEGSYKLLRRCAPI